MVSVLLFLTKQLCNRLLEPYMWHTVLITTSGEGLETFFNLRKNILLYLEALVTVSLNLANPKICIEFLRLLLPGSKVSAGWKVNGT